MRASAALGHLSGKLASVLYCCLKTMTPYDEKKHLQDMGFTNETKAVNEPPIEVTTGLPDASDSQNDIAEPLALY